MVDLRRRFHIGAHGYSCRMADLIPRVRKADRASLIDLTEAERSGKVVTLYIDLDPSTFATPQARESEINSLLSEAEASSESLSQEDKKNVRRDIEILRDFFARDSDWVKDARGVAAFCASQTGLFEVLKLNTSVEPHVVISEEPEIQPINETLLTDSYCVLLINRRTARILLGTPGNLREVKEIEDDVHGQHSAGGWSQARFERGIEEEVKEHLKGVADVLLVLLKKGRFTKLAVAALDELWPEFEEQMNGDVLQHFAGRLHLDIENSSTEQVETELGQLITIRANEDEKQLLGDLRMRLGRGERATCGIEETLEALNDKRVEILLIDSVPHRCVVCADCGWVGLSGDRCPVDSGELREAETSQELMRAAADSGASVRSINYHPDLRALGGVAAILRY